MTSNFPLVDYNDTYTTYNKNAEYTTDIEIQSPGKLIVQIVQLMVVYKLYDITQGLGCEAEHVTGGLTQCLVSIQKCRRLV